MGKTAFRDRMVALLTMRGWPLCSSFHTGSPQRVSAPSLGHAVGRNQTEEGAEGRCRIEELESVFMAHPASHSRLWGFPVGAGLFSRRCCQSKNNPTVDSIARAGAPPSVNIHQGALGWPMMRRLAAMIVMMAMTGPASTPLITALQQSNRNGSTPTNPQAQDCPICPSQ